MKRSTGMAVPFALWMTAFTLVPIGIILWFAFTDESGGFTLANFQTIVSYDAAAGETLFSNPYITALFYSLKLGLISTLICLVLAYPIAFSISRMGESAQKTMIMLIMLPMWMNFLLRTQAIASLISNNGLLNQAFGFLGLGPFEMLNTDGAIIFGLVYDFLPYMVLPLYSVMVKIEKSEIEAAQDLGANAFNVFRRVILPLSVPGIISGITMVFVPSVSTFVISRLLGGGKRSMIGDVI
ncbi:MAG: ABC transporter permease, partial [Clostridia bacterium]|nr:ABC transporter permease [Clostridia bacterium]